jgi:outer membrane receptor protein involved in Fe transport
VVTAQRRAESINDVGMSIQAIDAESLEALRVTSVRDLTTIVPSFTVSQSYQGVPTYTLRGIGFNTINLSATSTVGTYVDEVAYAYPIMNTGPLMDLERVEVLKGPQGTLYGRNTTAGLINFITAKPTDDFQAGATAEVGNYETYNINGFISGPLTETISARLALSSMNSGEGWQESNSRGERLGEVQQERRSGYRSPSIRARARISTSPQRIGAMKPTPVAGQGIGFTPATAASPFNAPGLVNYVAGNQPREATNADWAPEAVRGANIGTGLGFQGPLREDNPFTGLKLRLDQNLSETVRLVSLTSYNDFERDALSDWSGVPYEILLQHTTGTIESIAEDVHIEGGDDSMHWLVGGYMPTTRSSTAIARCSGRTRT